MSDTDESTLTPDTLKRLADKQRTIAADVEASTRRRDERNQQDISDTGRRILARLEAEQARRALLPCWKPYEAGDPSLAVDTAEAAGACVGCEFLPDHVTTYRDTSATCPRDRLARQYEDARERLKRARVPARIAERLMAAVPRRLRIGDPPPTPLRPTDALILVRAFLARRQGSAKISCSLVPEKFAGDEWALVLGGAVGVGKTIAGAWAVREQGGVWIRAAQLGKPDDDLWNDASRSRLLVLDDLGEEYSGAGGYGPARVAELLTLRHADALPTIVTTNMERAEFVTRYGARVNDRLREGGVWIGLVGDSLRRTA